MWGRRGERCRAPTHFAEPPTPDWVGPHPNEPRDAEIVDAMRRRSRTASTRTRALGASLFGALAILVATAAFIRFMSGPDVVFYRVVAGVLTTASRVAIARVDFAVTRSTDVWATVLAQLDSLEFTSETVRPILDATPTTEPCFGILVLATAACFFSA